MFKKIGVLTSGGDCAGLNAVIRAIVHTASFKYGWQIYGIKRATTGLINEPIDVELLTVQKCDHSWLSSGGTFLGTTNKDDPFNFLGADGERTNRSEDFIKNYHALGLDAFIGIGGDGSIKILRRIAQQGNLNFVSIPKTIDNDIAYNDQSVGFATTLGVAMDSLDCLQPTAMSHDRAIVLEVMGRDAGHIALNAGIAGGADIILIPEIPYDIEGVCQKIIDLQKSGKNHALVVVAEAVKTPKGHHITVEYPDHRIRYGGIGYYLGHEISERTGVETRITTLGHSQRGARPCAEDRILATIMGAHAVELVEQQKFDHMVTWKNNSVGDVPMEKVLGKNRGVTCDDILIKTALDMGIYLGNVDQCINS